MGMTRDRFKEMDSIRVLEEAVYAFYDIVRNNGLDISITELTGTSKTTMKLKYDATGPEIDMQKDKFSIFNIKYVTGDA